MASLMDQVKTFMCDVGAGEPSMACCGPSSCPCPCAPLPPQNFPFATVCMTVPPPIMAPTAPNPVKPLQLPCPPGPKQLTPDECYKLHYANFYNNYNIGPNCPNLPPVKTKKICEDYMKPKKSEEDKGCPTGFKPCTMKMTSQNPCHPCSIWFAEIQPCPPKRKKYSCKYEPGPCTRPCCKHWKSKEMKCVYSQPCKAHCYYDGLRN